MSATENKPKAVAALPSWLHERGELWRGDWTLPDPGQERQDDQARALDAENREPDGANA